MIATNPSYGVNSGANSLSSADANTTDLRSPLAKARDAWLDSHEGVRCRANEVAGRYLRNRLECAFIAGWNAAHREGARTAATRQQATESTVAGVDAGNADALNHIGDANEMVAESNRGER